MIKIAAIDHSQGVVIGDKYYWIQTYWNGESMLIYDVSDVSVTASADNLAAGWTLVDDDNLMSMAYDSSDLIYFIANKTSDGFNYLCSYSISGDVFREGIALLDVALMLDRNNDNSGDTPNFQEKAFANAGTKIYRLTRLRNGYILIQDVSDSIDFTASSTIVAITDNFIFVNNSGTVEIWEQEDVLDDYITFATVDRMIQEFSKADLRGNIKFSSNQIIELYDDDSTVR